MSGFELGLGKTRDTKFDETAKPEGTLAQLIYGVDCLWERSKTLPAIEPSIPKAVVARDQGFIEFAAITNELTAKGEATNKAIPVDKKPQEKEKIKVS